MTRNSPEFDQRVADWLEDDPGLAPGQVTEIVLAALPLIRQRRRGWFRAGDWAIDGNLVFGRAAAVAGLVIAGALALAVLRPAGFGGPGSSPTPTLPPPTMSPSATPGASPRITGAIVPRDELRLSPGIRYVFPQFEPAFTFTGAGIKFGIDGPSYAWLEHSTSRIAVIGVVQPRTAFTEDGGTEPVPTDIVAWLDGRGDLVITSATPVTLGGADGTLLEGTVRADAFDNAGNAVNLLCPDATGCDFESGGSLGYGPGDHVLILVINVTGVPVVAIAAAPETLWPEVRADADAFLRSFEFPG